MGRAEAWIETLGLVRHPEGGWYRETWRSATRVAPDGGSDGPRAAGTSIYFLLSAGDVSRLHRIRSDEVWSIHDGGPVAVHVFDDVAGHREELLSCDPEGPGAPQAVVRGGAWFGAELPPGVPFVLVGCAVAPGFEFGDLEMADRASLAGRFPEQAAIVRRLTAG
jgi:predicted cupin superfamily sugar epimerase